MKNLSCISACQANLYSLILYFCIILALFPDYYCARSIYSDTWVILLRFKESLRVSRHSPKITGEIFSLVHHRCTGGVVNSSNV